LDALENICLPADGENDAAKAVSRARGLLAMLGLAIGWNTGHEPSGGEQQRWRLPARSSTNLASSWLTSRPNLDSHAGGEIIEISGLRQSESNIDYCDP
jgi:predicted ABC-type transport system involved in lysophospholipase L1 biosynthesis ATPase subunit